MFKEFITQGPWTVVYKQSKYYKCLRVINCITFNIVVCNAYNNQMMKNVAKITWQ